MSKRKPLYKVVFLNQGKVYEIYAAGVNQGGLFGFVEVEGLLFGTKGGVVVDPNEEALEREFEGVERTYIPLHAVIRIDQVQERGSAKIIPLPEPGRSSSGPSVLYTPTKRES
jgi:hypothetical protein